jgi:hypothetical protein
VKTSATAMATRNVSLMSTLEFRFRRAAKREMENFKGRRFSGHFGSAPLYYVCIPTPQPHIIVCRDFGCHGIGKKGSEVDLENALDTPNDNLKRKRWQSLELRIHTGSLDPVLIATWSGAKLRQRFVSVTALACFRRLPCHNGPAIGRPSAALGPFRLCWGPSVNTDQCDVHGCHATPRI